MKKYFYFIVFIVLSIQMNAQDSCYVKCSGKHDHDEFGLRINRQYYPPSNEYYKVPLRADSVYDIIQFCNTFRKTLGDVSSKVIKFRKDKHYNFDKFDYEDEAICIDCLDTLPAQVVFYYTIPQDSIQFYCGNYFVLSNTDSVFEFNYSLKSKFTYTAFAAMKYFEGKPRYTLFSHNVLLQPGDRFILRYDGNINEYWYHGTMRWEPYTEK